MNRYESLISNEGPRFGIHDWLDGFCYQYRNGMAWKIAASCDIDGTIWVRFSSGDLSDLGPHEMEWHEPTEWSLIDPMCSEPDKIGRTWHE